MSFFLDGLKNVINQLANRRDAVSSNTITSRIIDNSELNAIFKSGIGRKIINIKVGTALKDGLIFDDDITGEVYDHQLTKHVKEACRYMLGFGRGVVIIIEKNKPLSDELSTTPANYRIETFDGTMVSVADYSIDLMDDRYMKPIFYSIKGHQVHHSRVIDFTYVKPIEDDAHNYNLGGISEFELIYDQLVSDGIVSRSGAAILDKNSTVFYKVAGFKNALRVKKDDEIVNFFSSLEDARSIFGAGIVDKEDEIQTVSQTLGDFEKVDTATLRRIAMVTSIPMSYLIGENVKGLNSSGSIEKDAFENMKESLQDDYIIGNINELLEKLGLGGAEFDRSLSLSPVEKAELDGKVLDNATKLFNMGEDYSEYLKENNLISDSDPFGEL